jgi:hypothetical protein
MRTTTVGWLIATAFFSAACHTLKPVTLQQVSIAKPSEVKVTRGDQSVVTVSGPQVLGDTLVGYVNGKFEELPGADLKQVRMMAPAKGRTTALIVATAVGVAGFAILLTGSGAPATGPMIDCTENAMQAGCPGY